MRELRLASSVLTVCLLAAASPSVRADIADACVECDLLYAGTCSGQLYEIDPDAGTSILIGSLPTTLLDLALSDIGVLYGNSGSLYVIDGCTGGGINVGSFGGNGLAGRLDDPGLYSQGPPLQRWEGGTMTTVGGAIGGGGPPAWCGGSSGDLAERPADGLFYSTLGCGTCPGGDMLVAIDPATGDVVAEIGCVIDDAGAARGALFGVAFDSSDRLWAVSGSGVSEILEIDPDTAAARRVPLTGGFSCGYGLASVPCAGGPLTCDAGGPYVFDCADAAPCGIDFEVLLDGSGSAAADGSALTHEWTVTCGVDSWSATGEQPPFCLPLLCGETCDVELTVADEAGLTASCSTTVAVVDDTPPTLTPAGGPLFDASIWPPSHGYVVFATADAVTAEDDCTAVTVTATGCASNQPEEVHQGSTDDGGNGDGRFEEDCVISEDGAFFAVRAERLGACGADSARVYTLEVTALDECGNAASGTGQVRVDHDRSGGPAPRRHALPPHAPPPFPYVHATTYGPGCGG